jgi:hypothetical protein
VSAGAERESGRRGRKEGAGSRDAVAKPRRGGGRIRARAAQATRMRDAFVDGRHLGPKKLSTLTRGGEKRSWRGRSRKAEAGRQRVSEGLSAIALGARQEPRGRMARCRRATKQASESSQQGPTQDALAERRPRSASELDSRSARRAGEKSKRGDHRSSWARRQARHRLEGSPMDSGPAGACAGERR